MTTDPGRGGYLDPPSPGVTGLPGQVIGPGGGYDPQISEPALLADPNRVAGIDLTGATPSTGLQNMIDGLPSNSYKKSIRLMPGAYYNPAGFTLDRPNVTLEGAGPASSGISGGDQSWSTTELRASDAGAAALTIGNSGSTDWRGCTVRDVGFSDGSVGHDQLAALVRIRRQNGGRLARCTFHDAYAAAAILAEPNAGNPQYWQIDQPLMLDVLKGFEATGPAPDFVVIGGWLWGVRAAATAPRAGSIGIHDTFGSMRVFGTAVQYFDREIVLEKSSSQLIGVSVEGLNGFITKATSGVEFAATAFGNRLDVDHANAGQYSTGRAVSFLAGSQANHATVLCNVNPSVDRVVDDNNGSTGNWFREVNRGGDKWLRFGSGGALPAAAAAYRGQVRMVQNAGAVDDGLYVCRRLAAGTYEWQQL